MAIPIQYIPEDSAAIARAQIEAEMAKTNASMWQAAQENAMRERLSQSSLAQDERMKMGLFDKEAALRQSILNQELGARAQEAAEARRAEMEKFRMAKELQEREPQTQLAREQLGVYRALTPEERINKALGRDPVAEKRDAERFAFEKEKFREQARQAELDRSFNLAKMFSGEEAKDTLNPERSFNAWMKVTSDIAKNPIISNVEQQLGLYSQIVASTPGTQDLRKYIELAETYLFKPGTKLPKETRERQAKVIVNLFENKKAEITRAKAEAERYRVQPEVYQAKMMQIAQEEASLNRLESSTSNLLMKLYEEEQESGWWSGIKKGWGMGQKNALTSALIPGGGLMSMFIGGGE